MIIKNWIKTFFVITAAIIGGVYGSRFAFRNSDTLYGKCVNSMFNMNTLTVDHLPPYVDVIWDCDTDTVQVIENSRLTDLDFGGEYGPCSFRVYREDSLIGSFNYVCVDRKRSYDFEIYFIANQVHLMKDGEPL